MSDEEEEEDPDANLIPNVKPGAFLGAYEVNDLAEVGISIVKDKSIDLLKEFIVTVNRADKSTGPPLANLCDFELQTPLHYACGKTGSVIKTKMLLDGYSDWRFENEFGLNAVHEAVRYGNMNVCEYLLSRGDVDFNVASGVFKCKGFNGNGSRCQNTIVEYGYCQDNPAHIKLAVEERRRQREEAVKKGLPDVTDQVDIDADNSKAQAVKDLVDRFPLDIAIMRGHDELAKLIDGYLHGNALLFENSFKQFLDAEAEVDIENAILNLKNTLETGWSAPGRSKKNLRSYLYIALLKSNPDHTHISVQRRIRNDGYMAMEKRLTALIETIYLQKKRKSIASTGNWTYRTEKVFQKLKETSSDIYSIHKQEYDKEEIWNNSVQEKIDAERQALNYKCDVNGFIKEPIELTMKPFISDEILQNENVIEESEWDQIPSRPTSAIVAKSNENNDAVVDTQYYNDNSNNNNNYDDDNQYYEENDGTYYTNNQEDLNYEKGYYDNEELEYGNYSTTNTGNAYDEDEPEKGNEKEYANTFVTQE